MKTTYQWLESYLKSGKKPEELASLLTFSGTEVEELKTLPDNDVVMALEVTSNRTDCLGALGLARELSTCLSIPLIEPEVYSSFSQAEPGFQVSIQDESLLACPFYSAQVIRDVRVGPSPEWLQKRLEALGCACVNNIVDITNFVLFEYSQPLHAFDLQALPQPEITVRQARADETFKALNHRSYRLDPSDLVITSGQEVVALAGIMGGLTSEVSDSTIDILLESAYFTPKGIKATGRKLDQQHSDILFSESRFRFERGVDPAGALKAIQRATQLILEIAGGKAIGTPLRAGEAQALWREKLAFRPSSFERIMGKSISLERSKQIFSLLGLRANSTEQSDFIEVEIPSFRPDLKREADLIEELARIEGLDSFPARVHLPLVASARNSAQEISQKACDIIRGFGFNEALTDTFVPTQGAYALSPWTEQTPLEARSPVNQKRPALRCSLMPSLIEAFTHNLRHGNTELSLYEKANIILPNPQTTQAPEEREVLALIGADFFSIKGALTGLFKRLHIPNLEAYPFAFPLFGEDSGLGYWSKDQNQETTQPLAIFGLLDQSIQTTFDFIGPCALAEINLTPLLRLRQTSPRFRPLPRFPEINRDLAFILDQDIPFADVQKLSEQHAGKFLRSLTFLDEFRGKQIPKGKKSLAFRLCFSAEDRTLEHDEINVFIREIVDAFKKKFQAELRDT